MAKFYHIDSVKVNNDVKKEIPEMGYNNSLGRTTRVLWSLISIGHIRDQHFSSNIRNAAFLIEEEKKKRYPLRFNKFIGIIYQNGLTIYGTKSELGFPWHHSDMTIDLKWWQKVWEYLRHEKDIAVIWIEIEKEK